MFSFTLFHMESPFLPRGWSRCLSDMLKHSASHEASWGRPWQLSNGHDHNVLIVKNPLENIDKEHMYIAYCILYIV